MCTIGIGLDGICDSTHAANNPDICSLITYLSMKS